MSAPELRTPFVVIRNPGQGSQFSGMGTEVAGGNFRALDIFNEATKILSDDNRRYQGKPIDMRYVCFEADDAELRDNHLTQLSVFTTNISAGERLKDEQPELKANVRGGHSVSEYVALVEAGVLSFEDALLLVDARARYMSEAGAMAERLGRVGGIGVALFVEPSRVEEVAKAHNLAIANYNAPLQTGLSGPKTDLTEAGKDIDAEPKGRFVELPVSVAVHSPDMNYAAEKLGKYIGNGQMFNNPEPESVVLNLTGEYAISGAQIASAATPQIISPVLWQKSMETAIDSAPEGAEIVFIEVGAKSVLNGIDKHFARSHGVRFVDFNAALQNGLAV